MQSSNIRYIPGLDHLRAAAALLIVFYHGFHVLALRPAAPDGDIVKIWPKSLNPMQALLLEGHTALTLFMVLSGFVLSVGSIGKQIAWWPFIKNRILRIYPLYLFVLILGSATFSGSYSIFAVVQSLLMQADFQGSAQAGTFFQLFWAVSVEFQFYLCLPLLHRFIERDGARWALGLIALVLVCRWASFILNDTAVHEITYWHLIGRIDQLVIGMLAARVYAKFQHRSAPWGVLCVLALALTLGMLTGFNQLGGWPATRLWRIYYPTVEALCWALVIITYVQASRALPRLLSWLLSELGSYSYSIYLFHWSAIHVALSAAHYVAGGERRALLFVLSTVLPGLLPLAALSFYVIERPFLAMRVRYHASESVEPTAEPARPG